MVATIATARSAEAVKKSRAVPVKNNPPAIIHSTTPALLVLVDGPPVLRRIPGLNVQRVINTRALIVNLGPQAPGDLAGAVGGVVDNHDLVDRAKLDEWEKVFEDRPDRAGLVTGRQADGDRRGALGRQQRRRERPVGERVRAVPRGCSSSPS